MATAEELVFLPLGGVGEIGMNLAAYGYGPSNARRWLVVDFGIAFAGPDLPGVDVIYPDISFLEARREQIEGIVLTHAHEDHFGAVLDLWPRLRAPIYATPFTAGLLGAKHAAEMGRQPPPVTIVRAGERKAIGPFEIELVPVTHSIPEPMAVAIRTSFGTVVHSGDWKIDPEPVIGPVTDEARLRAIGDEGVIALLCDSTNALRDGRSPSEAEVGRELERIIAEAKSRVVFTSFASNVARLKSIALAAARNGREVILAGRALERMTDVAGELGYLDGVPPFHPPEAFERLRRDQIVLIATGSQGEPRAAMARIAQDDHRSIQLASGDTVVFSSRPIPGNEKAIGDIINRLVGKGVNVITDRDRLVHVSGHPRRDELVELYRWLRPKLLVPVHGEAMHLKAQADLARANGIPKVLITGNGRMVRLAPEPALAKDPVAAGRIYRDGKLVGPAEAIGVAERRRLAFAGHVSVAIVLDERGDVIAELRVAAVGLPERDAEGQVIEELIGIAAEGALDSIPRARRRDHELVAEAVRRAVRAAVEEIWGKRPVCTVLVSGA
jgi:ribonuclease J